MDALALDHVLLAVPDLEAAAERLLAEHGLASVHGGRHEGMGTGNRIVPLGAEYLELIGVLDEEQARETVFGSLVLDRVADGERFLGWCLRTDDLDAVCERLGLEPVAWSRERPHGAVLRWRLAGLERAMADPSLPFFIQWEGGPELHPGAAVAEHRRETAGFAWVEVGADGDRLREWLGVPIHDLPVRVAEGEPGVRAVAVRGPGDEEIVVEPG